MSEAWDGTNKATYSYLANSPLVDHITFTNGSTTRMVSTRQFDFLNRLTNTVSTTNSVNFVRHNYSYNTASQRTQNTREDGSYWQFQYDSLGQVTSGKKYWSDGTAVAGQQFEYTFDDIGNRKTTAAGGDQYAGNLRTASYTANSLNQYSSRTVPGYLEVIGSAVTNATVTVNPQSTYRKGEYFRKELNPDNSSGPVWQAITNIAVVPNGTNADFVSTNTGNLLLAKATEAFIHDADGNLTSDSLWTNRWDGENRLTSVESQTSVASGARVKLDFAYDSGGRRLQKIAYTWNGSAYVAQTTNRFVYDGWNLVAELNHTNGQVRSYLWGLDLSGSMQGAGGVGGLLSLNAGTNGVQFVAYDGNGNITALLSATNGAVGAAYEYGPFGELIVATGPAAKANPLRFSTKYQDDETSALYYGYRSYNPNTGRWLNRDPIEEQGGYDLYGFVGNDPIDRTDFLGLADTSGPGSFSFPDLQFATGQTVNFKGCMSIGGPVFLCLSGGWSVRVGNCCDRKTGSKRGYFRITAEADVTFEIGAVTPFSVSYRKPFIENLARCPDEGGNLAWRITFTARVGPFHGQARYSHRIFGGHDGGRWVFTGSLSFTHFDGWKWVVSGGGGVSGSYTKLQDPSWETPR